MGSRVLVGIIRSQTMRTATCKTSSVDKGRYPAKRDNVGAFFAII